MRTRSITISLVIAVWLRVARSLRTPPNPSQPIFRVTVVGHVTPAINYRPRNGDTEIDFRGTTLMPLAVGEAKVQGKKGYIDIDAKFDKLGSPAQFGPEYMTYVLWAITPEGRATNLGEVQVKGDEARIHVTTELQAFGMILTAEPYFAVTQPSDVVVVENSLRDGSKANFEVIQAKYELLTRGTYLMNQDTRGLKLKPLEPGAPLDLAEARNAVMLARVAGADKYADDTYLKATRLLHRGRKRAGAQAWQRRSDDGGAPGGPDVGRRATHCLEETARGLRGRAASARQGARGRGTRPGARRGSDASAGRARETAG
jgi:hypothetical protein